MFSPGYGTDSFQGHGKKESQSCVHSVFLNIFKAYVFAEERWRARLKIKTNVIEQQFKGPFPSSSNKAGVAEKEWRYNVAIVDFWVGYKCKMAVVKVVESVLNVDEGIW